MDIKNNLDKLLIIFILVLAVFFGLRNKEDNKLVNTKLFEESISELETSKSDENINSKLSKKDKSEIKEESIEEKIYVHVTGCVNKAGVYTLDQNSRMLDLIDMAGGFCKEIDSSRINLSMKLKDEMKIHLLKIGETNNELIEEYQNLDNNSIVNEPIPNKADHKVNINKASLEELKTIPGIGDTKANEIIKYRSESKFSKIEEIKNISGIGDKTYEKLKDYIKVD